MYEPQPCGFSTHKEVGNKLLFPKPIRRHTPDPKGPGPLPGLAWGLRGQQGSHLQVPASEGAGGCLLEGGVTRRTFPYADVCRNHITIRFQFVKMKRKL